MRFRRGLTTSKKDHRLAPVLAALPANTHELVVAALRRDAVDRITVAPLNPTPFVQSRFHDRIPEVQNAYVRDADHPLFPGDLEESAASDVRMQALLEVLADAGHSPRTQAAEGLTPLPAAGGWLAYGQTLVPSAGNVTVKVFSLTGAGLAVDGQLAPLTWRSTFDNPVDYTGAQVELRTKNALVTLRLGERPGSTAAVIKAINVSERRRGSSIDLYRTASLLSDIRYSLTGEVAQILRGAGTQDRPPLAQVEVTVCSTDAAIALNRIEADASIRIHSVDKVAFRELQSLSTSHRTQRGLVVVGPFTEQLLSHTLAVHTPNASV